MPQLKQHELVNKEEDSRLLLTKFDLWQAKHKNPLKKFRT